MIFSFSPKLRARSPWWRWLLEKKERSGVGAFCLPAEAQPVDQLAVSVDVFPAQVVEEPATFAHEFEQSSAAGLVMLVPAEVLC